MGPATVTNTAGEIQRKHLEFTSAFKAKRTSP
jgi:hypothetical protein